MARFSVMNVNKLLTYLCSIAFISTVPLLAEQSPQNIDVGESYISLGSFRSKAKAKNMSTSLNIAGYEVFVRSAMLNGLTHHRVLVGPIPEDKTFQQEFKQWLASRGYKDTWVVRGVKETPLSSRPSVEQVREPVIIKKKQIKEPTGTKSQIPFNTDDKYHPARLRSSTQSEQKNLTVYSNEANLTKGAPEIHFSGYGKSFAVVQDEINNPLFSNDTIYQSQNSLRLMLEAFGERAVWQLHYEVSPVMVSRRFAFDISSFNIVGDSYRLSDIDSTLSSTENKTQIYQNLDRLNLQLQLEQGDLTIGRQAISFGSARIVNPTDVFLPFDVQTFNTEYRTGVDAVRFQRPLGELGELDVGVVLGDGADSDKSAAFLQLRGNINGKDLHFALIEYAEQTLTGVGLETSLGDFGFWLEAANVTGDEDFVRASLGLDYAFTEFTFGQVEYHYNGAGSDDPDDYISIANSHPYQRGGVFLFGEQYLIPTLSVQLSPLWVVNAVAILNLSDDSSFISLSAAHNVAENFYMDYGIYLFSGDDLDISPLGAPMLGSEYGSNPDMFYTSLRYYF